MIIPTLSGSFQRWCSIWCSIWWCSRPINRWCSRWSIFLVLITFKMEFKFSNYSANQCKNTWGIKASPVLFYRDTNVGKVQRKWVLPNTEGSKFHEVAKGSEFHGSKLLWSSEEHRSGAIQFGFRVQTTCSSSTFRFSSVRCRDVTAEGVIPHGFLVQYKWSSSRWKSVILLLCDWMGVLWCSAELKLTKNGNLVHFFRYGPCKIWNFWVEFHEILGWCSRSVAFQRRRNSWAHAVNNTHWVHACGVATAIINMAETSQSG